MTEKIFTNGNLKTIIISIFLVIVTFFITKGFYSVDEKSFSEMQKNMNVMTAEFHNLLLSVTNHHGVDDTRDQQLEARVMRLEEKIDAIYQYVVTVGEFKNIPTQGRKK